MNQVSQRYIPKTWSEIFNSDIFEEKNSSFISIKWKPTVYQYIKVSMFQQLVKKNTISMLKNKGIKTFINSLILKASFISYCDFHMDIQTLEPVRNNFQVQILQKFENPSFFQMWTFLLEIFKLRMINLLFGLKLAISSSKPP